MASDYGTSGGVKLTSGLIGRLADEAERGYEAEELVERPRRGRPPMGTDAATVFHVRLQPELRKDLDRAALAQRTTASSVMRTALKEYLARSAS